MRGELWMQIIGKRILLSPPKSNKLFLSFGVVSKHIFLLLIKIHWCWMTVSTRRSVWFGSQTCRVCILSPRALIFSPAGGSGLGTYQSRPWLLCEVSFPVSAPSSFVLFCLCFVSWCCWWCRSWRTRLTVV